MAAANLLFVAGASPQIITETAYCLLRDGAPAPTDIHVLTTTTGREIIARQLLQRGGYWSWFRREYPQARFFCLEPRNIVVLRDARGAPLADVRSAGDNVAAADQIASFVAERTRDGSPPLHASIAGGRKTMGYLLAAAMMLHGRREDRLSHVLVHPAEIEGTDFYFPRRRPARTLRYRRPDGTAVRVAGRDIRVELADLPFLRLRAMRDAAVLHGASFSTLVEECQADLDALARPRVTVLQDGHDLLCSDRPVPLSPVRLGIYELLAQRRRDGCGRRDCCGCARCFVGGAEIGSVFRGRLRERLKARQSPGVGARWGERDFRAERSKINGVLRRRLRRASERYEIQAVGGRRERRYGLLLDPAAISITVE